MQSSAAIMALATGLLAGLPAAAEVGRLDSDPHYSAAGFFDMHVCNWPDKGVFYMLVFSTVRHAEVQRVEVLDAAGRPVGDMDLNRYREHPKQKGKRIYITHLPLLEPARDGWFTARIHLKDGGIVTAGDFLVHTIMAYAGDMQPADQSTLASPPRELKWTPPPGSTHWTVTIRDTWDNDALVHATGTLTQPTLTVPDGVLKPGGAYAWQVHARDNNGNVLLGDFNHGSMSKVNHFQVDGN
jgi:hypothetical protein